LISTPGPSHRRSPAIAPVLLREALDPQSLWGQIAAHPFALPADGIDLVRRFAHEQHRCRGAPRR
jgi:hypothetical protein